MSSFKLCSDEDVFYHLDFPTKCKFRRCSRQWNHLLRSADALHTVVFTLSPERSLAYSENATKVALQPAFPHLVNLAVVGNFGYESNHQQTIDIDIHAILTVVWKMPAVQLHERRLFLCHFSVCNYVYMDALYKFAVFNRIVLKDVTLTGELVLSTLIKTLPNHLESSLHDPTGVAGIELRLSGWHVLKNPSVVIGLDPACKEHLLSQSPNAALFGLIRENMRHLSRQETSKLLERLSGFLDQNDAIQDVFVQLLKVFEPDLMLSAEPSWLTFEYSLCSPLVGRMLACYYPDFNDYDYDDDYDSDD